MTTLDVLTMGRVGVDIYPQQVGRGLDEVESFGKYVGGSPTNVAVAAARYGRSAAVLTKVGADTFGAFVRRALRGYGVDDRYVGEVAGLHTPVTFCEIFPPDNFPIYFYGRSPTAPDLQVRPEELDLDAVRNAALFWVTASGLCQEPSRSATLAALEARGRRGFTVLDLDYRPMFWGSAAEARAQIARALPHATVAVGNREECEVAVGENDPRRAAKALHGDGIHLAVIKQGPAGVLASDGVTIAEVPPLPVDVVNGLGAGDAFGGALCHMLLAGEELERAMRFCNAAGAIVTMRIPCSDAMPTAGEVTDLLSKEPSGVA